MTVIRIEGLDKVLDKVNRLISLQPVKAALKAGALHLKGKIAIYPPATEANQPGQRMWYERGYGTKWMRKGGGVGGRRTSETLGRKWTIAEQHMGLTQIVGNNVSYGPFVQGEQQARFHAARGWKTTDQVAEEEIETVAEFVRDYVEKALGE